MEILSVTHPRPFVISVPRNGVFHALPKNFSSLSLNRFSMGIQEARPFSLLKETALSLRKTPSVAMRSRRSGDQALEKKPLRVNLRAATPQKDSPRKGPMTHHPKRPRSKAEEPHRLLSLCPPSTLIMTQFQWGVRRRWGAELKPGQKVVIMRLCKSINSRRLMREWRDAQRVAKKGIYRGFQIRAG
jgi:hypothetical protein